MKKILMISYYYPPLLDVGSLRALGFSQNLPAFGWQPYVLSVKNPDKSYCIIGQETPPENVRTVYTRSLFNLYKITGKANGLITRILKLLGMELKRNIIQDLFCIPDIFIGWIPLTLIRGLSIIKKYKIDVIYVSCKPFSSALTGTILKKMTKKPLILDFRDPVSSHVYYHGINGNFRQTFKDKIVKKIEEKILRTTDILILTSQSTMAQYISLHPFIEPKAYCIYNGYDGDLLPKTEMPEYDKFTIIYVGLFYRDINSPEQFFRGLKEVISRGKIPREKIQFLYFGQDAGWVDKMKRKYGLNGIVITKGFIPRKDAIKEIFWSSIFLLRSRSTLISAKIYEALAAGKPILSLNSNTEVAHIVNKYSNNSYVIFSNNVEEIAKAIYDAYIKWENGELNGSPSEEYLQEFNKKNLIKKFVRILEYV